MDKKNLMIGILFLIAAAYCAFSLATKEFQTFFLSGLVVFALVGIGFIKKSRSR